VRKGQRAEGFVTVESKAAGPSAGALRARILMRQPRSAIGGAIMLAVSV
jgi:hypothetical protein